MTKSATATHVLSVGVHEAKTRLSELLRAVASGQEVVILRNGSPIARLVPARPSVRRQFGHDRGSYALPDDFDAPLPDEVVDSFER